MTPESKPRRLSKGVPAFHIGKPFNPYKLFTGIHIPEALVRYRGVSLGAKVVYGRLARYAGENGDCYPAIPTLASEVGIGTTQARAYVHELRDQGFIVIEERSGTSASYKFIFHPAFAGEIGQTRKAPPLRITGGVPLRKTGPPPLRKTGDEENHHQESQKKESQTRRQVSASVVAPRRPSVASEQKQKPFLSVDDEKQNPKVPQYASPWDEVRAELAKANRGAEMTFQDQSWLREQMEVRRLSVENLLELIRANPLSRFHTPIAGLKWLVKKAWVKKHSAAELERLARVPSLLPVENPRCDKCSNFGRVLERIEGQRPRATDQYCDCAMGKDLEAVEKRPAQETSCLAIPTDHIRAMTESHNWTKGATR